jgi:predicted small secreted protein
MMKLLRILLVLLCFASMAQTAFANTMDGMGANVTSTDDKFKKPVDSADTKANPFEVNKTPQCQTTSVNDAVTCGVSNSGGFVSSCKSYFSSHFPGITKFIKSKVR